MSNRVVFRHLARLIEEARLLSKALDASRLHVNHPLITHVEHRLSNLWRLSGSIHLCENLEQHIREQKERNPDELQELVRRLVNEYYEALKLPFQRVPPPPWIRRRKKRKVIEVVAA